METVKSGPQWPRRARWEGWGVEEGRQGCKSLSGRGPRSGWHPWQLSTVSSSSHTDICQPHCLLIQVPAVTQLVPPNNSVVLLHPDCPPSYRWLLNPHCSPTAVHKSIWPTTNSHHAGPRSAKFPVPNCPVIRMEMSSTVIAAKATTSNTTGLLARGDLHAQDKSPRAACLPHRFLLVCFMQALPASTLL